MRRTIYVACAIACVSIAPQIARAVLASAVAVLFEATPYVMAAAALTRIAGRRFSRLLPYIGCGCGYGPGARSVPAALATALLFGPTVALARFLFAAVVGTLRDNLHEHSHGVSPLRDLLQLAPSAAIAGVALYVAPTVMLGSRPAILQWICGLLLGFFAAPCALGSVAIAGALHSQSPLAASAYLCVAGVIDLTVWRRRHDAPAAHDALAYVVLAGAACAVAAERGAALVHPRIALALWACVPVLAIDALRYRASTGAQLRWIPAAMLAALVFGAPQPVYRATETTLADAFPGERIDFTGQLVRTRGRNALVRYAITCCRADAQPVVVALAGPERARANSWIHATGTLRERSGALQLVGERETVVTPPLDPFVYR